MSQEFAFTQLIGIRITRLSKPQMAFCQNLDLALVPHTRDVHASSEEIQIENDIADKETSCDDMFIFPTKFGRVYMGQKFRGVLGVSNSSKTHSITKVHVKITLLPQKKVNTQFNKTVVLNTEINEIAANSTWSPVFEIDIDDVDSYVLLVETQYSSEYFRKELERHAQLEKFAMKTAKYEVDHTRKVTIKYHKKYKYESLNPFNVSQKIHKTNSGYVLQITFETCVLHPILIEDTKFLPHKDFEVVPSSTSMKNDIFESSQSLKTGDKRSYIVKLNKKTEIAVEDLLQYYKLGHTELGRMMIIWVGGFGEKNLFYTKTMTHPYPPSTTEVFAVKLLDPPPRLIIEEPIILSMKVTNMSPNAYKLNLYVNESETKTIAINSLSCKEVGRALPFQSFVLQALIYPKHKGIQRLTGIHAKDMNSNMDMNLGVIGEFLVTSRFDTVTPT